MPEPQEQPPPDGGRDRGSALEKVAYVTAPATVVLGLLYYFGRTYTDAYYAYFEIPANDLQLSLQAYVARSPTAVSFPFWMLLVCGLVVLLVLGAWAGSWRCRAARRCAAGWCCRCRPSACCWSWRGLRLRSRIDGDRLTGTLPRPVPTAPGSPR
ncbi:MULTISPECIES: hypothetical protein [Streptomyces]|uniref:hypothetical protein n=1 Tax=Streptomyces TaxID=1883 RepID=UPI001672C3E9|nr:MULTISPECIES: hypothetical protein [Streptomyces]MBD3579572.1 hypothetical protein [Streptomyces sp. KD18]GGS89857.1 hypothetical protein GCM10010286_13170 [Streptomyces toxytricini]